jgi:integration host factor subunit beta
MSSGRLGIGAQASMAKSKSDLIDEVAERTKLPVVRVDLLVSQVFACIAEAFQRGEGVEIRGFGSFTVRSYGEYVGRNPRSGDAIQVRAKRLPFFKVGKELRERLNLVRVGAPEQTALKSR